LLRRQFLVFFRAGLRSQLTLAGSVGNAKLLGSGLDFVRPLGKLGDDRLRHPGDFPFTARPAVNGESGIHQALGQPREERRFVIRLIA
jgi:hypothetical protein